MPNPVSALAFAAMASMPADAEMPMPTSAPVSARIDGVPMSMRAMSVRGSYVGPIANWSRWLNHPQIGCVIVGCRSSAT